MKMGRKLVALGAASIAVFAVVAVAGAAKPDGGTYSWVSNDNTETVFLSVADNGKTTNFQEIAVFCGQNEQYRYGSEDSFKIKNDKFAFDGKMEALDGSKKKFEFKGDFVKSDKAKFKLDVAGCGKVRKGTLTPLQ